MTVSVVYVSSGIFKKLRYLQSWISQLYRGPKDFIWKHARVSVKITSKTCNLHAQRDYRAKRNKFYVRTKDLLKAGDRETWQMPNLPWNTPTWIALCCIKIVKISRFILWTILFFTLLTIHDRINFYVLFVAVKSDSKLMELSVPTIFKNSKIDNFYAEPPAITSQKDASSL